MLKDVYKVLLSKVNSGDECLMLTYLNLHNSREGSIEKKVVLTRTELEKGSLSLEGDINDKLTLSLETGQLQFINVDENKAILIEPFLPKPRLIVFGGGHIAKPLSEFASRVGFTVTVIDDRPFFANYTRFPHAEKVICESFQKSFDLINLTKTDYVVIVTRGHRHDGLVLREVLNVNYDLRYVGMIGSKRRVKGMMNELAAEGYSKEKLDLVNSPIGIDISAITPDEIALSIVAQLISFKNRRIINNIEKKFTFPEFDAEVAEKIFEDSTMAKALFTIVSSKGSVPRKAGAKMIAYFDGRTVGSIGGGCSEAGVITSARKILNENNSFLIEHVDMTGDVAEAEGMVCGGTMEVLVEVF